MAYRIEWEPRGAIKHFSGWVTFLDVYDSELKIQASPAFDHLRYVISIFETDEGIALTVEERETVLALRLGAKNSNPRIKYAYVSSDSEVREEVEETVRESNSAFPVKVFENVDDAKAWATVW